MNNPLNVHDPSGFTDDDDGFPVIEVAETIIKGDVPIANQDSSPQDGDLGQNHGGASDWQADNGCRVGCHFGNNNYNGVAYPGTDGSVPKPPPTPAIINYQGMDLQYVGPSTDPARDTYCMGDACYEFMTDDSVMHLASNLLGISLPAASLGRAVRAVATLDEALAEEALIRDVPALAEVPSALAEKPPTGGLNLPSYEEYANGSKEPRWTRTPTPGDRGNTYDAQGGFCAGCGKKMTTTLGPMQIQLDHPDPFSKYGPIDPAHAQGLCPTCNLEKSDMDWEDWLDMIRAGTIKIDD
jgi:hypothetical protein